jgi:hypothetical protein
MFKEGLGIGNLGIWEFGNLGKKGKKESIFWKNIDQKRK